MEGELCNGVPLFTVGQEHATFVASCGTLDEAQEEICGASMNHEDTFVVMEEEGFIVEDSKYGECKIQDGDAMQDVGINWEWMIEPHTLNSNDHAFLALNKVEEKRGSLEMNIEELDVTLSKNQSAMAELEWFKGLCKVKGIGYYDYFKTQNDQKNFRTEMLRISLESFWDSIAEMEKHELPIDIQFQNKWIDAGTIYRRRVEPLDIADYYGKQRGNKICLSPAKGLCKVKGIDYSDYSRYQESEWFKKFCKIKGIGGSDCFEHQEIRMDGKEQTCIGIDEKTGTMFASFTRDSCFRACVEEACKGIRNFQQEKEQHMVMNFQLKEILEKFEDYVWSMIGARSTSIEVLLEQSSFTSST